MKYQSDMNIKKIESKFAKTDWPITSDKYHLITKPEFGWGRAVVVCCSTLPAPVTLL